MGIRSIFRFIPFASPDPLMQDPFWPVVIRKYLHRTFRHCPSKNRIKDQSNGKNGSEQSLHILFRTTSNLHNVHETDLDQFQPFPP